MKNKTSFLWAVSIASLAGALLATSLVAGARDYLPPENRTNGEETIKAFRSATQRPAKATVTVYVEGKRVAQGTVVAAPGYLLSKASELSGPPKVRVGGGNEREARIIGKDPELDLALLKICGEPVEPVSWGSSSQVALGDWVAAPNGQGRAWAGIVGAERRTIERAGGALGVLLSRRDREEGETEGARIEEVYPESAAEAAGIERGDRIRAVNGESVSSSEELIELVKQYDPGETISVRLDREGEEKKVEVTLGYRAIFDRFDRNQRMGGKASQRRTGFQEVIQHTIPLTPDLMGGPLVNLKGETIGINIARVDRVTTYALPSELVEEAVERLLKTEADDDST
jgi:S1-C subfamily serine protease